jgi:ATP-dependent Clp protease ATP-binding subunit ClpA
MFERFTQEARQVVVSSQDEARQLHHNFIGTEHLLLGLLDQAGSPTCAVFERHGLTRTAAIEVLRRFAGQAQFDAAALGTVGIDLDAVRASVEATFGPGALDMTAGRRTREPKGHIPFTARSKKVLELSLRETIALKSGEITDGSIALGLIREGEGLAAKILHDRGIDLPDLAQEIRTAMGV